MGFHPINNRRWQADLVRLTGAIDVLDEANENSVVIFVGYAERFDLVVNPIKVNVVNLDNTLALVFCWMIRHASAKSSEPINRVLLDW